MVEIITIGGFESAAATAVWYKIYNKCNKCRDRELPDQVRGDTGQARGDRQKHSPDQNTITAREFYMIETVNVLRSTVNDQRSTHYGCFLHTFSDASKYSLSAADPYHSYNSAARSFPFTAGSVCNNFSASSIVGTSRMKIPR